METQTFVEDKRDIYLGEDIEREQETMKGRSVPRERLSLKDCRKVLTLVLQTTILWT